MTACVELHLVLVPLSPSCDNSMRTIPLTHFLKAESFGLAAALLG